MEPSVLSTEGIAAKVYEGWKLDHIEVDGETVAELPSEVKDGAVVVYHYVVDESQTKDLKAIVDYALDGVIQTRDREPLMATVQVLEPSVLSTEGVAEKVYEGWKLDHIEVDGETVAELPSEVKDGAVVVYHYVVDESQTKDLKAIVDYALDGVIQTRDREPLTATV